METFDCEFVLANIGVDGDIRKDPQKAKKLVQKNYDKIIDKYANYNKLLLEVDSQCHKLKDH